MDIKNLNNKVFIRGRIINSVRSKYLKDKKKHIVYFVVAVPRTDYSLLYNNEAFNYFYCYTSDILVSPGYTQYVRDTFKMYDLVEIKGILDNMPHSNTSKSALVNHRALSSYISTICIIDIQKIKDTHEQRNREIPLMNKLRKTFGMQVKIEIADDAFEKDAFGIENNNELPNY